MNEFFHFGRTLIIIGLVMAIIGLLFMFSGKIPLIGRLPGDFMFRGKHFTFYFPLGTSIVVSIVLSLLLYFFFRGK